MALAMPHFLRHHFNNALIIGRRAVELNPGFTSTYKGYLAILGHLSCHQEANRVLSRLLELDPAFSIRDAIERSPMQRQQDLDLYAEACASPGCAKRRSSTDGWPRLFNLEMRLGRLTRPSVDRQNILRAGRESYDEVHLRAQPNITTWRRYWRVK